MTESKIVGNITVANIDEFCLCKTVRDPASGWLAIHFQSLHFDTDQKQLDESLKDAGLVRYKETRTLE